MLTAALAFSALLVSARAQLAGTLKTETHPKLTVSKCTASGCTTSSQSIVIDANWRWLHTKEGYTNCYTGNTWNATACATGKACAQNCALEGADYSATYGITTSGNSLKLNFVTKGGENTNVGSRTYLMEAGSETKYQMLKLMNQEFTFDVDVSKLPCGLNGALYFSEMEADGGLAKYSTNKAGAKYGTGYCDAQCPRDVKFINGEANSEGWTPSEDENVGGGKYGSCCNEMDIWEGNSISTAYTPHPCSKAGQVRCEGKDCGIGARYDSICDADGCDFNSFRMGNKEFYGPGATLDTGKVMTVVTQFISTDGTANGNLKEIKRFYVQGGKTIANSETVITGTTGNSLTDAFCEQQKTAFGDQNIFKSRGGMKVMGDAIKRGMVLVMSVWDDATANMLWLDAPYPPEKDESEPGVARGTCARDSGKPEQVRADHPGASVTYSNIKWGPIGSTFKAASAKMVKGRA